MQKEGVYRVVFGQKTLTNLDLFWKMSSAIKKC